MSEYEKQINSLIPKAVKEANQKIAETGKRYEIRPGVGGEAYNHCFWTEYFHAAMKRMAIEQGYRSF